MCGTQGKLKYKCRCVGIGRRPRLKIVWRDPCGFESHHRHHVGAKSALLLLSNCDPLTLGSQLVFFFSTLPTSEQISLCSDVFFACGRKDVIHSVTSVPPFKIATTLLGRDFACPMRAVCVIYASPAQQGRLLSLSKLSGAGETKTGYPTAPGSLCRCRSRRRRSRRCTKGRLRRAGGACS